MAVLFQNYAAAFQQSLTIFITDHSVDSVEVVLSTDRTIGADITFGTVIGYIAFCQILDCQCIFRLNFLA